MKTHNLIVIYKGHVLWMCFPKPGMRGIFRRMYPDAECRHVRGRMLESSDDNIWETRLYISMYFPNFAPIWDEFMK